MAEILIEGIKYKNLDKSAPNGITGIGVKRIGNAKNMVEDLGEGDIASKLVNAVEIDWNGAIVSGQELNTTGEVLSMLQTA